mmetsp:Transcript_45523/g.93139  ORF Transcript_45523/g.93139 Transcript_45523/m.93139 type:complete len:291 (-) Transcript_45523:221-1093(-)
MVPPVDGLELCGKAVPRIALAQLDEWRHWVVEVVHNHHPAEENIAKKEGARRGLHLHHTRLVIHHVVIVGEREGLALDGDGDGRLLHLAEVLLKFLERARLQPTAKRVVGHDQARGAGIEDGLDRNAFLVELKELVVPDFQALDIDHVMHEGGAAVGERACTHCRPDHLVRPTLDGLRVVPAKDKLPPVLGEHQREDPILEHVALWLLRPRRVGQSPEQREWHTAQSRRRKAHAQNAVCLRPIMSFTVRHASKPRANIVTPQLYNVFRHKSCQRSIVQVFHLEKLFFVPE